MPKHHTAQEAIQYLVSLPATVPTTEDILYTVDVYNQALKEWKGMTPEQAVEKVNDDIFRLQNHFQYNIYTALSRLVLAAVKIVNEEQAALDDHADWTNAETSGSPGP